MVRLAVSFVVGMSLVAGCSSEENGVSEEMDREFVEGREMVEVFRLMLAEGFDPEATVREWADLFGIEDQFLGPNQDVSIGLGDGDQTTGSRSTGMNLQTGSFSFGSERRGRNNACDECADATIDDDVATERAQEVFASMGFDIDELEWSVDRRQTYAGNDSTQVVVEGQRTLDGMAFGRPFRATFGDGDELLSLQGSVFVPVSRGEVALLTPRESLAQESAALAVDVPVESVEGAALGWDVSFDRSDVVSIMVPVYRFPLNEELGLSNAVLAIRSEDVPTQ